MRDAVGQAAGRRHSRARPPGDPAGSRDRLRCPRWIRDLAGGCDTDTIGLQVASGDEGAADRDDEVVESKLRHLRPAPGIVPGTALLDRLLVQDATAGHLGGRSGGLRQDDPAAQWAPSVREAWGGSRSTSATTTRRLRQRRGRVLGGSSVRAGSGDISAGPGCSLGWSRRRSDAASVSCRSSRPRLAALGAGGLDASNHPVWAMPPAGFLMSHGIGGSG
jgi:hypothetical protein